MFNDFGNLSTTFQEMIPNFHYLCYDFSDPVRRKAKGDLLFEIFLMVQDFVYITDTEENQQMWREIIRRVQMIHNIDRMNRYLEMFVEYIMYTKDNMQPETLMEIFESVDTERSGIMPTIAEQLIGKGRIIGREEGRQEGRQEGRKELLIKQIKKKFKKASKPYLKRVDDLHGQQLEDLSLALLDMNHWEELKVYLTEKTRRK